MRPVGQLQRRGHGHGFEPRELALEVGVGQEVLGHLKNKLRSSLAFCIGCSYWKIAERRQFTPHFGAKVPKAQKFARVMGRQLNAHREKVYLVVGQCNNMRG